MALAAVTPVQGDTLTSLIRSVKKEHVRYYLQEKHGLLTPENCKLADLGQTVSQHAQRQQIIGDLTDIATFSHGINEETYREMARDEGIDFTFQDPTVRVVIKTYLRDRDLAESLYMYSQATKLEGFTEIPGLPGANLNAANTPQTVSQLQNALRDLIQEDEPGRRCVVKVRPVQATVVMVAYVEQRQKKVYTLSASEDVEAMVFKPTTRSVAIYDIATNRLRVRTGPSTKLQQRIAQSFGRAYFQNNDFFSFEQRPVYNLDVLSANPGAVTLDPVTYPDVLSVRVIEETLRFTVGQAVVLATFRAPDVEEVLPQISSPATVNFAAATRVGATFEFRVRQTVGDKAREQTVKVCITHGNRIEHDPRFREMIHDFLRRWGMEQ